MGEKIVFGTNNVNTTVYSLEEKKKKEKLIITSIYVQNLTQNE